jgi:hypothetical protein
VTSPLSGFERLRSARTVFCDGLIGQFLEGIRRRRERPFPFIVTQDLIPDGLG